MLVRSPHAHARIRRIDAAATLASPGVVGVFTGADMAVDGVSPMRPLWIIRSRDAAPMAEPPRFALARETVCHVGEPIAAVIAEDRDQAADAAERVVVDYEVLPAIVGVEAARAAGAPQLHAAAPGNICFRWARGDETAVRAAFDRAAHMIELELVNNRLIGAAIEPRAVLATLAPDSEKLTLYSTTQVPHHIRRQVTEQLGIPESAMRVVAPDVGGGFGYKGKLYPEESIMVWAARRLRRPVRWIATRAESFLADNQGRDHLTRAALALDGEGRFLALRVQTYADLGAYVSTFGAAIPSAIYSALLAVVYRTPAIFVESIGVFTNTMPTDAYRGAGRPEACYVLERLADAAARKLNLDRAEIRERNLIPPDAMPYKTPIGPVYDCGDFPKIFARTLALAGYEKFAARREAAARRGRLRGIGFACYVESSGVAPSRFAGALGARAGFYESAAIRVEPDGAVRAMLGTHNHGQGHATSFAQILVSRLGVPVENVDIIEGDTDRVPYGTGTFGSRSIAVGGCALDRAAEKIIAKGKLIAAHLLEAAAVDIEFADGFFAVAGPTGASPSPSSLTRRTSRTTFRWKPSSPALTSKPLTIRRASLSATARTSAKSRSSRRPAASRSSAIGRWTTSAPSSIRSLCTASCTAALRRARGKRCSSAAPTIALASSCRARSWTMRCRAPTICPASSPSATRASPAPTIRSAPRAAAKPGPSLRQRR